MAIADISGAHVATAGGANSVTTSPGKDSSGGNFVALAIARYAAGSAITITDSKSNTPYIGRTERSGTLTMLGRLWYCQGGSYGSGHTWTGSGTDTYSSAAAGVFSGVAASPYDTENFGQTNSNTSLATGNVTLAEDNELIIASIHLSGNPSSMSVGSGFTLLDAVVGAVPAQESVALAFKILGASTAGAFTGPTFSWTGSCEAVALITAFKAAAAGGGITGPLVGQGHLGGGGPLAGRLVRDRIRMAA